MPKSFTPSLRSRSRRTALVFALASSPLLIAASSAARKSPPSRDARFHLSLMKADPKINDTIAASPKSISLWFTESVGAPETTIRLTGSDGKRVKVSALTVNIKPMSPAVVAVPETLKPGTYTVTWNATASDGDPATGKFKFTVRAP